MAERQTIALNFGQDQSSAIGAAYLHFTRQTCVRQVRHDRWRHRGVPRRRLTARLRGDRPDWKNRISDFRAKMDSAGLRKCTIIASNVTTDEELAEPASMIRFLEPYGRDIAVVDIHELVDVFAMELSADELRAAINQAHSYLTAPRLCGRADIIVRFSASIAAWLDQAGPQ